MPPVGFEPTISAGERPHTYALDRAATGDGLMLILQICFYIIFLNDIFRPLHGSSSGWTLSFVIFFDPIQHNGDLSPESYVSFIFLCFFLPSLHTTEVLIKEKYVSGTLAVP